MGMFNPMFIIYEFLEWEARKKFYFYMGMLSMAYIENKTTLGKSGIND